MSWKCKLFGCVYKSGSLITNYVQTLHTDRLNIAFYVFSDRCARCGENTRWWNYAGEIENAIKREEKADRE